MTIEEPLLSVVGQHLAAGFREPRAVRLQAAEHDLIAIVHDGAAEARDVARAGIVSLLREGAGSKHNKWNDGKYSDHLVSLRPSMTVAF